MGKTWIDLLMTYHDTRPKQVARNTYIYLMLSQLQMGHLYSPFKASPPKTALPPCDRYVSMILIIVMGDLIPTHFQFL